MRVVLVLYIFLAGSYAAWMPLGKGPDESAHVLYIQHLSEKRGLPIFAFNPDNPDPNYEFHQPPLYYALCLPTYLLAGENADTAQRATRFCTLLVAIALIYLTLALGRKLVPEGPWIPVAAAGLLAFLPAQLTLSSSIGNDALTEVFSAATLVLLVGYLQSASALRGGTSSRQLSAGTMAAVGLMIGLGMLTKSVSVLLLPVAWVAAVLAARGKAGYQWRQLARDAALVTLVALLVCGWWLVLNQRVHGDPLAQDAFLKAFQGRRPSPQEVMADYDGVFRQGLRLPVYLQVVTLWTFASALGVFGPTHGNHFIFYPSWVYVLYGAVGLAGVFGFARYLSRSPLADWQRQAWWVCGLFGALLLASFVRFNFSFFQAQARYLFPVLPAAAVAFCVGLRQIAPARWGDWAVLATVGAVGILALVGFPFWVVPRLLGA